MGHRKGMEEFVKLCQDVNGPGEEEIHRRTVALVSWVFHVFRTTYGVEIQTSDILTRRESSMAMNNLCLDRSVFVS